MARYKGNSGQDKELTLHDNTVERYLMHRSCAAQSCSEGKKSCDPNKPMKHSWTLVTRTKVCVTLDTASIVLEVSNSLQQGKAEGLPDAEQIRP